MEETTDADRVLLSVALRGSAPLKPAAMAVAKAVWVMLPPLLRSSASLILAVMAEAVVGVLVLPPLLRSFAPLIFAPLKSARSSRAPRRSASSKSASL